MFSTMRVGLIGLGTMGTIHAKNLIGRSFWVRSALPVPPHYISLDCGHCSELARSDRARDEPIASGTEGSNPGFRY